MKIEVNKILTYVIIVLSAIIVFCTVTAFAAGKASFRNYRKKDPSTASEVSVKSKIQVQEFKEFGTLRALTKPESEEFSTGTNLVITPWFSYEQKDSAFYEELSHKKKGISTIILNYFSNHTEKELYSLGEKKVKQELLKLINNQLTSGKISAVYFDDYIFLD